MSGREEIEVVPIKRVSIFQESVTTDLGMDGIHRTVMVIEQHAHAWIVACESTVGESRIRGMIAIIGLAVEDMFLEVPIACLTKRTSQRSGIITVVEYAPLIVVLHDEPLIDKGEIEVAWYQCTTSGLYIRNACMERVQIHDTRHASTGVSDLYLFILGNLSDRDGTPAIIQSLTVDSDALELLSIADLDVSIKLCAERLEIHGLSGGQ